MLWESYSRTLRTTSPQHNDKFSFCKIPTWKIQTYSYFQWQIQKVSERGTKWTHMLLYDEASCDTSCYLESPSLCEYLCWQPSWSRRSATSTCLCKSALKGVEEIMTASLWHVVIRVVTLSVSWRPKTNWFRELRLLPCWFWSTLWSRCSSLTSPDVWWSTSFLIGCIHFWTFSGFLGWL